MHPARVQDTPGEVGMADLSKYRGKGGGESGGGGGGEQPQAEPPKAPEAPAAPPTKAGKAIGIAFIGLGVAAFGAKGKEWLDKRKAPEVAVVCKAGESGVECTVEHKVGPKANACFSVEVACEKGKPSTGKTCKE